MDFLSSDIDTSALDAADAYAQPETDLTAIAPMQRRVHKRPTVERVFADFCNPRRLTPEAFAELRARTRTEDSFRSEVFAYIAATVLSDPSRAHQYRYPHARSLAKMFDEWQGYAEVGVSAVRAANKAADRLIPTLAWPQPTAHA